MNNKEFVTPYGLFSAILVTIVGIGIFSYPRELAVAVGNDGWIVTLVSGGLAYGVSYITYKAIKINNFNRFYTIMEDNFGRIFGAIFSIIFVFYNVFIISIGMRIFVEVIKMYLLEKTPTEFLLIVTILTGMYLIRGEVDNVVKFNEIALWIMFVPIVIVLLLTLNNADFTNMLPVFNNKPIDYIKGLTASTYSFIGFEIMYLLLPFMKNKRSIPKSIFKGIAVATLFYIMVLVFSIAVFSREQTKVLLWPTITMIKSINIPGTFIERWEGVVMAMWVIFYFTTFTNFYYLASDIIKDTFRLKDVKLSSALIIPFIYVIALYPQNIADLYYISKKGTPILWIYSLIILPLMLILANKLRKQGKEVEE